MITWFKETLSNKHFLFRFFIFLLQQVHITILITKMQKQMRVTDLLFELQLSENSHAQAAGVRENSEK